MDPVKPILGLVALIAAYVVMDSSFYVLPEGRQAIITQFGRPIGTPTTEAGMHLKLPFIQAVRYVDKRILTWDGYPNQIPTKDKKYIVVDTTARWRINEALKFIETVQDERGAKARLDAILDAATRDTISNHNLVEAVRNTNLIIDAAKKIRENEDEVTGEIEKIEVGREHLSDMIAKRTNAEVKAFGIEIIDVQLRRISYETSVEKKVYERMVSERKRIAEKIRSVGKGEQAKIQGKTSKELQRIESEAYRKAQFVRGKAEAESTGIYARAMQQDKKFYEFTRTMEAYDASLAGDMRFILSTDGEFFELMKSAQ